jgi:hypothetical protein
LRCACESLRYDFSAKRVLHPIVHSIRRSWTGNRSGTSPRGTS